MKLLEEFLKKELRSMMEDGIRLRAIGDLSGLPDFAKRSSRIRLSRPENEIGTSPSALNYGSRQEVLKAVAQYAQAHPDSATSFLGRVLSLSANRGSPGSPI